MEHIVELNGKYGMVIFQANELLFVVWEDGAKGMISALIPELKFPGIIERIARYKNKQDEEPAISVKIVDTPPIFAETIPTTNSKYDDTDETTEERKTRTTRKR
jgi:hypothetical protein